MANEAVIIELLGNGGDPIRFTVSGAGTITKGTLMVLNDARSAAATSTTGEIFAGIAASDKISGATSLSCYTNGIFDLVNSTPTIAVGQLLATSGANFVRAATEAEVNAGKCIGKLMEAAGAAEVVAVRIGSVI